MVTQYHKAESQALVDNTELPPMETSEEAIPQAIVPWNRDDDRARYLGLRASGFTIREALSLIGKAKSTLSLWRLNPVFKDLEENHMAELRKTLALEYAGLEYLRNYRLILEKDARVIRGSLTRKSKLTEEGVPYQVSQDSQDFQYLLKLRAHYTPQQLQAIEQLFGRGTNDSKVVNWTDLVLSLKRTTEEVKVETRHRQESQLTAIEGDFTEIQDGSQTDDNSKS